jgi:tRNA(adenine34) deaminase
MLGARRLADDASAMHAALELARQAPETGDVPVGAVLLAPDGAPVAGARNCREALADPTAHAEISPCGRPVTLWARGGWTAARSW